MNERILIQPHTIRDEIERLMGRPVVFAASSCYDVERDLMYTHFRFELDGYGCDAHVTSEQRALSLDEFSRRILEPMVAVVKA